MHDLDRIRRLLEEERRLAGRVGAHLARVGRVVAADAVDAAHRKRQFAADDRHRGLRDCEGGLRRARCAGRQGATGNCAGRHGGGTGQQAAS
jgi:hypothetical protein